MRAKLARVRQILVKSKVVTQILKKKKRKVWTLSFCKTKTENFSLLFHQILRERCDFGFDPGDPSDPGDPPRFLITFPLKKKTFF